MPTLKEAVWNARSQLVALAFWLVANIPLAAGNWLRARLLRYFFKRLGAGTVIQSGLRVTNPEKIAIGANCNIAQDVFITGGGGVTIGDWVGFGPDVKIWSVNHRYADRETPWLLQGWDLRPVTIENDVWLGANVFVMPGVTIGKGAVVSACSMVNKTIPPFALVAGNPARVIGWRGGAASAAQEPQAAGSQVADEA